MAGGKVLTPIQLQKTVFLFQKAIEEGEWPNVLDQPYEFIPYDYGPFCKEIYWSATCLEDSGLVKSDFASNQRYLLYNATANGLKSGQQIAAKIPKPLAQYFEHVAQWVRERSFSSLVSSIYKRYPAMAENSVFYR